MKIAVIGVGGSGSAALRFLALGGHEAVGFEQFRLGHNRGSSHGESRIIRYTYPDLLYTQMMGDAYPLWDELQQESGEELMVRSGGVVFGPPDHPTVRETRNALEAAGLPFETLDTDEARKRFPALRLRRKEVAVFQEASGFLRSTRCVLANAAAARSAGAVIHEEARISGINSSNGKTVVCTAQGEQVFDRIIVTAGAWMSKLLGQLDLPLRVEQRQYVYLPIKKNAEDFEPGTLPVWIDAADWHYGFPLDGQLEGVKLASHILGHRFDPDRTERLVVAANINETVAFAAERFPDLGSKPLHAQACLYTLTPDEDFIIDEVPELPGVWMVSACSGHGFKFTVLLGKIIADLATGGSYHRDLSRFSVKRFG